MILTVALPWRSSARSAADSDEALLVGARQGDQGAFDALRTRHNAGLKGFVARRVGVDAAEDLTQDIWLACWAALPKYAGRSRFKPWLYGIAAHKCADHFRGREQE